MALVLHAGVRQIVGLLQHRLRRRPPGEGGGPLDSSCQKGLAISSAGPNETLKISSPPAGGGPHKIGALGAVGFAALVSESAC